MSYPPQGRIAIVTDAGWDAVDAGCVVARERSQGGLNSVSGQRRADERRGRGRQSRVVLAPVAGVKSAEIFLSPTGPDKSSIRRRW
jgi:hypothetical protein